MSDKRLVAVLSDLGTRDPALSQFKCAALRVNPNIDFIDITHDIRPHDLLEAAFTIDRVFRDYPTRTAFVVLVDQFRGAPRPPLLAVTMDYFYLAPDNGVLSFIYQHDPISSVYDVDAEHYIKKPANPLAHHCDIYGSSVGWLTKGIDSSNFGDRKEDYVRTQLPTAVRASPNELKGMVLAVDRFGSLITNLPLAAINGMRHELGAQVPFQAVLGDKGIPVVGGWQEGGPEVFAAYGSAGYLEITAPKTEAAKILGAKRGDAVSVMFSG